MNKIKLGLLAVLATAYSSTTIYAADPTLSSVKLTGIARTLDAPVTIQAGTPVWVKLTITSGSNSRTEEFPSVTTNEFGQFTVNIGAGNPVGATKGLNELVLNNDTKVLIEIKYAAGDSYKVIAEKKYLDIIKDAPPAEIDKLVGFTGEVASKDDIANAITTAHTLPVGQIFIGDGAMPSKATARTITGDITISSTGEAQVEAGAITTAEIANGTILPADIDLSKNYNFTGTLTKNGNALLDASASLSNLAGTSIGSLATGQYLRYNADDSRWENKNIVISEVTNLTNDLATLTTNLDGKVDNGDFDSHTTDTDIHVSTAEKAGWDAKLLTVSVGSSLNGAGTSGSPLSINVGNANNWTAKQTFSEKTELIGGVQIGDGTNGYSMPTSFGTTGQVLTFDSGTKTASWATPLELSGANTWTNTQTIDVSGQSSANVGGLIVNQKGELDAIAATGNISINTGDLTMTEGKLNLTNSSGGNPAVTINQKDNTDYGLSLTSEEEEGGAPLLSVANKRYTSGSAAVFTTISSYTNDEPPVLRPNPEPTLIVDNQASGLAISVTDGGGAVKFSYGVAEALNISIPDDVSIFMLPDDATGSAYSVRMPSAVPAGKVLTVLNSDGQATTTNVIAANKSATFIATGSAWVKISESDLVVAGITTQPVDLTTAGNLTVEANGTVTSYQWEYSIDNDIWQNAVVGTIYGMTIATPQGATMGISGTTDNSSLPVYFRCKLVGTFGTVYTRVATVNIPA